MSDPITPDALRALADEWDTGWPSNTPEGALPVALRAAADTIEALTAERDALRATVERVDRP